MGDGTVEEYLQFPYELAAHRERAFDRQRVVELLETLGRDASFLEKQQGDLSGGETQLAALLRVVQLGPEVLLLDEPTAALDAAATRQVEALVSAWYDGDPDEHALIWVSHDAEQARRVATRTLRLDQGRLVEN
jgi:putative ABC transport system ATP-binding protein